MAVFGLRELEHAFDKVIADSAEAARAIVAESAAKVESTAKKNFEGSHRKGAPHVGGDKPNVVSGTLRRSYRHDPIRREGLVGAVTRVGPSVVYARAVELGFTGTDSLGRRRSSRPFPSFEPAIRDTRDDLTEIARRHWSHSTRSP